MFKFNVDKKYSQIPNYVKAIEYVFGLKLLKQEQVYFYKSICVCLSVPRDFANRWTDIVLHYSATSHRSWEDLYCRFVLLGRVKTSQEKTPQTSGGLPRVPPEVSKGVVDSN